MIGVVIPAFRGEATLQRSVISLASQTAAQVAHVVIAVNDRGEETMRCAARLQGLTRSQFASMTVLRSAPGRAAAFNAAERDLPFGPRLYLDQDAALSAGVLEELIEALKGSTHFAAPGMRIKRSASVASRCYYRAWQQVPYVQHSPVTIGAYAVSAEGRQRWGRFPDVAADDRFVRLHFRPEERRVLETGTYEVIVPEGPRALIRARTGYTASRRQLARASEATESHDIPRYLGKRQFVAHALRHLPSYAVFCAIHGIAAVRA